MGRLDGLQRLDGAYLFDRVGDPCAAPQPGRVDEHERPPAALERNEHAVAGRPRRVVGDHPLLTQQAVDEGGFAGVRPAEDRDADRPPGFARTRPFLRLLRAFGGGGRRAGFECEPPHEPPESPSVGGRHADRRVEAERVELHRRGPRVEPVRLVDREHHRLAEPPEAIRDRFVGRGPPRARVHDEQDPVRLVEGAAGLRTHPERDLLGIVREPAGVHHDEARPVAPGDAVPAIAGEPRPIPDDRVPGAGELVEQGRLSDVRPPHDGDDGKYGGGGGRPVGEGVQGVRGGGGEAVAHAGAPLGKRGRTGAAAVSIAPPPFQPVMAFQRRIVNGLAAGAVKG